MWNWADIKKRFSRSYNICPPQWTPPSRHPDQVQKCLDSMRQYAEESKAAADSTRPGAVDLAVENVLETDAGYDVAIDGEVRKSAVTGKTCAIMSVGPGLHELEVVAVISGSPAHASQIVNGGAATALKVSIILTKAKAAGAP